MKELHSTQEQLLSLLRTNIESPLTIRELQTELNISSPSVVFHHIQQLERKGYLKRDSDNPKDYVVLDSPEKQVVYLPKYGLAQCGPDGSILDGNPIDRIPIASRLLKFPVSVAFIVEAKGNSMEPKIKSGDILIAQKQNYADEGEIIICVNDSQALVKKFSRTQTSVVLHSLNVDQYQPFIAAPDFRVEGVVKNIIHYD